ncbi:Adhesion Related Protein [Spiroplasma poulsonii]|uniref:Uncharacterized protein n=1 Tax=Spiroplasma poulsonii TaxID=2138 RepID=A0A2P6FFW9_9MOLU|nr:Adhesion Related Protein [Spiroplasma poulsonii]KAF0851905.1 Adhesion Related Protein [Spiroplasma poulsonii]PQM30488.1 hypothetical protein SMSRO_SF002530 [Spiroplasma poulsonii]PQM32360.1 hypothetical protein SMSRO_SF022690 [Spiroplasma poulsonii]PWF95015.1 hypothetical protein SMSE_04400 [Spiroplasma poulsonii]
MYSCDENWQKNGEQDTIDLTNDIKLDGSQLDTYQGQYLIETEDNAKNKSSYYVVINKDTEKD